MLLQTLFQKRPLHQSKEKMTIADSAYDGTLTLPQLQQYISIYPSSLNAISGKIDLTPLCAACLGGHLHIVKDLLACNADPDTPSTYDRTPIFFVTDPQCKASSAMRCAIIRELVLGRGGAKKADLNKPCDDDKNTALMNAIVQLKDKYVLKLWLSVGTTLCQG